MMSDEVGVLMAAQVLVSATGMAERGLEAAAAEERVPRKHSQASQPVAMPLWSCVGGGRSRRS